MKYHKIELTPDERAINSTENGRDMMSSGIIPRSIIRKENGLLYIIEYDISETSVKETIDEIVIKRGTFTGKVLSIDFSNSNKEDLNVLDQLETPLQSIQMSIDIVKQEIINNF